MSTSCAVTPSLNLRQAITAGEILRNSANSCVRLSILHLYLTIFCTTRFRVAVFAMMTTVACYWMISLLSLIFLCRPVAYLWDKSIKGGRCLDITATYLSVSVINLGLDLVVIALPMPTLWTLQMPLSRKVAISVIFALGLV